MSDHGSPTSPLSGLIAKTLGGGTPPRAVMTYWNGSIPWASVKDLQDDSMDLSTTTETITAAGLAASASNIVDSGIPIVCIRMAVGRCAVASQQVAINQDLKALVPRPGVSARFLLHALKHARPRLQARSIGSTVKGVAIADLLDLQILVCSELEQGRIAEILDTTDEAIRKTEQVIAKLQQMKQGLLHDLLTRGIDENGELRDPERHPEQFQDSPLGRIPMAWKCVTVSELAVHVGSGLTPRGGSDVYRSSGVLFIRSQNVHFDGLRLDDVAYISSALHESMGRSEVFAFDVLLNITGASIGRVCFLPAGIGAANVNQHVCAIRLGEPNRADALLLSSVLGSFVGQRQIYRLNAGGNREGLNYQQLRSFKVPWPAQVERSRMAELLDHADRSTLGEQGYLVKLRTLKHGLMDDLLTGRVRVSVSDEGAS